jgi:hypothetical protein
MQPTSHRINLHSRRHSHSHSHVRWTAQKVVAFDGVQRVDPGSLGKLRCTPLSALAKPLTSMPPRPINPEAHRVPSSSDVICNHHLKSNTARPWPCIMNIERLIDETKKSVLRNSETICQDLKISDDYGSKTTGLKFSKSSACCINMVLTCFRETAQGAVSRKLRLEAI